MARIVLKAPLKPNQPTSRPISEAESFDAFVRPDEGPKLCCQYAKTV